MEVEYFSGEVYNGFFLTQVKSLTDKEYYVGGCTALLAATGRIVLFIRWRRSGIEGEWPGIWIKSMDLCSICPKSKRKPLVLDKICGFEYLYVQKAR